MQAEDAWGKEIFCIQQGNFKGSLDATAECSIIQEGLTGFEISMLEEECEDPLWFRLCFCGGESTKYCLSPWACGCRIIAAAVLMGHEKMGQPLLITVSRAPLQKNVCITFFLPLLQ